MPDFRTALSPSEFRTQIVDPAVLRGKRQPDSLLDAFCVMWAIDAYATHVALAQPGISGQKKKDVEINFKNKVADSGCWQFRLIREASNATKHAIRENAHADVSASGSVYSNDHSSWSAYFQRSEHRGRQILIDIEWQFDQEKRRWRNGTGDYIPGRGPLLRDVPVLNLIQPALEAIDSASA
ncbi:hypothetical protein [Paracoccus sp. SCSIO 75233]|uniref:hypothetical protein n=1 Tax=Paracoccus sp. SCSIO 75233 TaxID=3017782 RepID=UPI0022F0D6F9|nr:hypothetical protein [Paracoccus sp. SCSIO 75233]WBU54606.1 hypothetical protein PAF12_07195 [Paracoccus sp. SCSIO 75233]